MTETNATSKEGTPAWFVILLFVLFWPAALFFVAKEEKYRDWIPFLLWLFGGISLSTSAILLVFVLPKLTAVYRDLGISYPSYYFPMIIIILLLMMAQILFAFYVKKKLKIGELSKSLIALSIIFLIISIFVSGAAPGLLVLSAILPIYTVTSAF